MYKLTNSTTILRTADSAFLPADPANTDYAQYLQWLAEGNTPEPADPVVIPIPSVVTMRQTRLALLQTGRLASVNAALAAMPGADGEAARIEWEYSQEVQRSKPLVAAMAQALSLSEVQLDDLFTLAASL